LDQNLDTPDVQSITIQPAQSSSKVLSQIMNIWSILLCLSLVALVILAIGGYTLNWTWTGFSGNTLWDWLQLFILPIVLAITPIWLVKRPRWRTAWTFLLILIGIAFVVLAIGGYTLNWTWTGFSGNTLWNWLQLFILPIVLAIVTVWLSSHEEEVGKTISARFMDIDHQELN
jgi:heme/copper-type cytochrome/quinol oxidase subunit 4